MSTENNILNQDIWSSGSQRSKSDATRKILMTSTNNFGAMLFPKKMQERAQEMLVQPETKVLEKSADLSKPAEVVDEKKDKNDLKSFLQLSVHNKKNCEKGKEYPGDIKTSDDKKDQQDLKTFRQISEEQDPGGKGHDLRITCVKCGDSTTCRCPKPKRQFYGVCPNCEKSANEYPGKIETKDEKKDKYERARAALIKCGYDPEKYDTDVMKQIESALIEKGSIASEYTGKAWLAGENELQEPPAAIRPESLKIGDKIQMLRWRNLGVRGANIDLFPEPAHGKVSKIYRSKVKISKEKMPYTMADIKGAAFNDEDRVVGLELDGHGPSQETIKGVEGDKKDMYPLPYGVRESSVVLKFDEDGGTTLFRQPPLGSPSGATNHVEPSMQ